jgi:CRISPR-associated endonuclease/helicase Cas3
LHERRGTSNAVYAHTLTGEPPARWETLKDHAVGVAELAELFASAFGASEWGRLLGLWHDLGKASNAFQKYLHGTDGDADASEEQPDRPHLAKGRVDHSTCGARHAIDTIPGLAGQLLAFCIAGHHGGLADANAVDEVYEPVG